MDKVFLIIIGTAIFLKKNREPEAKDLQLQARELASPSYSMRSKLDAM